MKTKPSAFSPATMNSGQPTTRVQDLMKHTPAALPDSFENQTR
jgi:hypothetical protein